MPKGIDPKAYAARITRAKKVVEAMDPATRAKIKEMYPPVKKEAIVKKALDSKKTNEKMKSMPKAKITGTASSKPQVSGSMSKSQPKTATKPRPSGMAKPVPLPTPSARPRRGTPVPLGTPPAKPTGRRSTMPRTTKKAATKPQVAKRAPLQTKRIGGVFAVPVKPKKTIY